MLFIARGIIWFGFYLFLVFLPLATAVIANPTRVDPPFLTAVGVAAGFIGFSLMSLEFALISRGEPASTTRIAGRISLTTPGRSSPAGRPGCYGPPTTITTWPKSRVATPITATITSSYSMIASRIWEPKCASSPDLKASVSAGNVDTFLTPRPDV